MRILFLIHAIGVSGGAENNLLDLLPELKRQGIYCELICVCPPKKKAVLKAYCDQITEKGIKSTLFTASSKIAFVFAAHKVARYMRSNDFHIINSHLINSDLIAVLVKKLYFKKLIILSTKHGYEEEYLVQYGLGNKKIRQNLYYYITKMVMRGIDHNLTISNAVAEMYYHLRLGKSKMKYIHHGISPLPMNVKQVYVEGDPKIIIVGRLSEMKGHTYLINALPTVIKQFPQLKLLVLGEGALQENLKNLAKSLNVHKHIEFVGFVTPAAYIPQCEVVVLPSLFEPFGLVYIESFASKIPVVAFDTQAANEIIEDNKTGILVHKIDAEALAEKIIYLLKSPEIRKKIIENAYNKYLTYYTAERMAKETVEWYKSVLSNVEK